MASPKHLTFSFYIDQNSKKIITPVTLFPIPYNASLSVSTEALWDTGASISVIVPEIMNKLNVTPVDKKTIAGIHTTQTVDIVYVTVQLPNGVLKKTIEAAVCNIPSKTGMILGMDIILLGDFALSNGFDQTLFSFAVPPFKEKIDFSKKQNEA